MKKLEINIPTLIAFLLVPVMVVVRLTAIKRHELILYFAVYCFIVCVVNFIMAHRAWKQHDPQWQKLLKKAHTCNILLFISLVSINIIPLLKSPFTQLTGVLFITFFILSVWFFPMGIVLLFIWGDGLGHKKERAKQYLKVTFIAGLSFSLVGGLPAFIVSIFMATGHITMCYCPVNRRSFPKDLLLRPLYSYRRRKLAKRLNI